MCSAAFDAWLSLFNENAADAWAVERKELRNAAMLLCVLDVELQGIRKAVNDEFYMCQSKLKSIETFKERLQNNPVLLQSKKSNFHEQKENRIPENYTTIAGIVPLHNVNNQKQSLLNTDVSLIKQSPDESGIELNPQGESSSETHEFLIDETSTSPKINKPWKFSRLKRPRDITNSYSVLNTARTPKKTLDVVIGDSFANTPDRVCNENKELLETTIIDVTPEPPHEIKKIKHSKVGNFMNQKRKLKRQKGNRVMTNSTLTQMFSNVPASTKNEASIKKDDDSDLIYCPSNDIHPVNAKKNNVEVCDKYAEGKQDSNLDNHPKNVEDDDDDDLTYCPTSDINLLNVKGANKEQLVKSITKACPSKFDDERNPNWKLDTKNPQQKPMLKSPCNSKIPFKMKPVRGKERLKLEGWDCNECKNFYEGMGENFEEAKNLMNKCSRHRNKFKPDDYTVPGFWDMNFSTTQKNEENESKIFHI